jgi:hypothetical protein
VAPPRGEGILPLFLRGEGIVPLHLDEERAKIWQSEAKMASRRKGGTPSPRAYVFIARAIL